MKVYGIYGSIPGKLTEISTVEGKTNIREVQYKETLKPGTLIRMKSGSQGWIRGEIVEYYDVIPVPSSEKEHPRGGYMYGGGITPGYKVRVLEGKHKGEVLNMPMNYIEVIGGVSGGKQGTQFPHVTQKKTVLYPHKG
jgi:hypothetical protein